MPLESPFNEIAQTRHWNSKAVLRDYRIAFRSRECSILARAEVFSGRAKFGIFGEGKECAQLAMAYAFKKGDFRSGYYRDQTLMFALGLLTTEQFFAQLYAHADVTAEPAFGGRSMTGHFATRLLDESGHFLPQTQHYNSAADLSPTASQMPRLVGLAYASKLYRQLDVLKAHAELFSSNGNEIVSAPSASPVVRRACSGSRSTRPGYFRFLLWFLFGMTALGSQFRQRFR
jgi:TPP-dependent pyruvate/acetoin dehydrogenase alpha subunit